MLLQQQSKRRGGEKEADENDFYFFTGLKRLWPGQQFDGPSRSTTNTSKQAKPPHLVRRSPHPKATLRLWERWTGGLFLSQNE
jgi:hypothetical protein